MWLSHLGRYISKNPTDESNDLLDLIDHGKAENRLVSKELRALAQNTDTIKPVETVLSNKVNGTVLCVDQHQIECDVGGRILQLDPDLFGSDIHIGQSFSLHLDCTSVPVITSREVDAERSAVGNTDMAQLVNNLS
jgi:hypothetical protein